MYYIKRFFLRKIYRLLGKTPLDMPMVQYWKTKSSVQAKVTTNKDGALVMKMEGEKEEFPGFPRGHLLFGWEQFPKFGTLAKLKHEIKNQLFNESWRKLEEGQDKQEVIDGFKKALFSNIAEITRMCRYDMVPPEKMFGSVREIYRAFTVLEKDNPKLKELKEALTYILQEDDAFRFRVQWLIQIFNPSAWWFWFDPIKWFSKALGELVNAEVVGDMKLRIKLLQRILLLVLEDKNIKKQFYKLCKEMDWNKLKLSRADKYHFRGKYFKVDFDKFEY